MLSLCLMASALSSPTCLLATHDQIVTAALIDNHLKGIGLCTAQQGMLQDNSSPIPVERSIWSKSRIYGRLCGKLRHNIWAQ